MKRTGFSSVLRVASHDLAARATPVPRQKTCQSCRVKFTPARAGAKVCSPACAVALVELVKAKTARKFARAQRAADKLALDAYKTIPKLKAEAQIDFNRYIRARDEGQPCICCDGLPIGSEALTGGAWDAGHFRSRGSADHLRYDENNCFRQLKSCNQWGATDMRGGVVKRIGLEACEAVESDQSLVKWTREMLEAIKTKYRAKFKELQS